MKNFKLMGQFFAFAMTLMMFVACEQEIATPDELAIEERSTTTVASYSGMFYGLSPANVIYTYRVGTTTTLVGSAKVGGLRDGELLLAIDVRPATKVLYGVSNMNAIYTINVTSGYAIATLVSDVPFTPGIQGTTLGFDFNPSTDQITLVTNAGQNLKIDPVTGRVVSVDFPVKLPITGSAYWGATLFGIDANEAKLYRQDPTTGALTLVGPTGLVLRSEGGFDATASGQALAAFFSGMTGGSSATVPTTTTREAYRVYNINLKTGQATRLGEINPVIGIAIL
jgi:hypothetical protein